MSEVYSFKMNNGIFKTFNNKPGFEIRKVLQKHTNIIVRLEDSDDQFIADGIVSSSNEIICTLTADCLPIALEGKKGHAIVHAGWRGLENKILEHSLLKEIDVFAAHIGPSIKARNYPVGPEFLKYFPNHNSVTKVGKQHYFDSVIEATTQLRKLFNNINITNSSLCTFESNALHSYRENQTSFRNWNLYIPN